MKPLVKLVPFILLTLLSCNDTSVINTPPIIKSQTFIVKESITDTETIGEIIANDKENTELTFKIVTNNNNLFEITKEGILSLSSGKTLDYETTQEHTITISVTDGTEIVEEKILIKVENVIETLFEDPESFILTWKITKANASLVINRETKDYTFDYTIDWGDGTIEKLSISNPTHVFKKPGIYTVAIKGKYPFLTSTVKGSNTIGYHLNSIEQWGTIQWESLEYAFFGWGSMKYNAQDTPDLSKVTSLSQLFYKNSLFNGAIDNWDVSNITNMSSMFGGTESFNQSLNNWNVSNVKDMSHMFEGALIFNQDLNNWDVSNVTNMRSMFAGSVKFNGNIDQWNVKNVTNMGYMFVNTTDFNRDINNWNVSNVLYMRNMFGGAKSFNQNLSNWDVSKVQYISAMFSNTESFNQPLETWDVSSVVDMNYIFSNAKVFDQDLGKWNIKNLQTNKGQYLFINSGLSKENYGKTLIGWSQLAQIPNGLQFNAKGLEFCNDNVNVVNARKNLTNNYGWEFNYDIGITCN
ncbi:BspA family leucine-rich repeat surface protein [Tenacibaculum aiptasiae]|uniref:BspA family leucine-rich repeat surface protein n=1 Tax=Tenacibaculum aiptasiae TaxID=426481 RepID=UPI003B58B912